MNRIYAFLKGRLLLLSVLAFTGCGPAVPGVPALPERKKLPGDEKYTLVPMPDASGDSAVISLIATVKPMAIQWLTQWTKQNSGGFKIDLRSDREQLPMQAEYRVQLPDATSFRVIFIWDINSSTRAAGFMNTLESFSGINAYRLAGNGAGNCFQP